MSLVNNFVFFFSLLTTEDAKHCWKCQIEIFVRVRRMQASTMWFILEDLMYEISCDDRSPFMEGEG